MRLLGLDPGIKTGAWALISKDETLVGDIPSSADGINPGELFRVLKEVKADHVVLEKASSRPGQGVSSIFRYGQAFGTIIGVVGASYLPYNFVTPAQWKGAFKLAGKDKEAARAYAIRLYPHVTGLSRKLDHNRAEALLIAHWFAERKK